MHKVFAELIAGLIPDKMARNRWRGILRFGIVNALVLQWQLKKCESLPAVSLAVCAIAKDEGQYFKEWLDWHLGVGVQKFYIYDNESTDETKAVLKPYVDKGIVEYIYFPGYRRQLAAYDDCLKRHRFDTRWIAFIDLDEFLVPVRDRNLLEFLERYSDSAAVEINWLVYGSGNQKKRESGDVMRRFRHHAAYDHKLNRVVKSIVNPRKIFNMIGCHEAARISGHTVDACGKEVTEHYKNRPPQLDVIHINHYAVKSLEEFMEKRAKGRASGKKREIDMDYFTQYDLNDLNDLKDDQK